MLGAATNPEIIMSISLFKKGKITQSGGGGTGDGTFASPYDWSQVSTGSDKTVVDKLDMISVSLPWSNRGVYVRVNLTAGTEYRLFMNAIDTDTLIAIYHADAPDEESSIEINDDWDEGGSCLYFTPDVTGDYFICYSSYPRFSEGERDFTTTIGEASVNPAPNNITAGGSEITYTYETSSGFDAFGYPIKGDIASAAGCALDLIPTEGLIFYAPLSHSTTEAVTGQQLAVTGSVKYTTIDDIDCAEFSGDNQFICSSDVGFPTGVSGRTVSAFVRRFSADHDTTIVSYGINETNKRYSIGFTSSGEIESWGNSNTASFDTTVPVDTWVHIAVTFSNGIEVLYLNGSLSKEVEHNNINTTLSEACIGACATDHIDKFVGNIAAVRVYNRVLSEQEIKRLSKEFKI